MRKSHRRQARRVWRMVFEARSTGKASAGILRAVRKEGGLNVFWGLSLPSRFWLVMVPTSNKGHAQRSQACKNKAVLRSTGVVKLVRAQWLWNPVAARGNGEILMPRTSRWIAFGLLLVAPAVFAQATAPVLGEQVIAPHRQKLKAQKEAVLPPMPSGPLSQLPMDQIPATPAKVSFQDGLLTISAQNSTLGEILREVRKLTGASIEMPPSPGANERVVVHIGPGAPRDVLVGLLNGSSFNYVMLGSASDPMAVASIILTTKASSPGDVQTTAAVTNVYQGPTDVPVNRFAHPERFQQQVIPPAGGPGQPGVGQPADADDKDDDDSADDADDQAQPGQPGQPEGAAANANNPDQPADPNQPNAGPKTPEQILDMLRRQQPGGSPVINNAPPPPEQ
jgi:hypothetical protein